MKKSHKIIYWVATVWMCFGMTYAGIIQIMQSPEETTMMQHLGYPNYLLPILGSWKILGVIALLMPKFPLVKEWAYAGFIFTVTGALASHIISHDGFKEIVGPSLFIVLITTSWYFRPADRRITSAT